MAISDWPIAERPRERLLAKGASILSDAELLAVLLRTGLRGKSAVELARELLEQFNGLTGLRSEEHTSELQSRLHLVCRLLLEKKKKQIDEPPNLQNVLVQ